MSLDLQKVCLLSPKRRFVHAVHFVPLSDLHLKTHARINLLTYVIINCDVISISAVINVAIIYYTRRYITSYNKNADFFFRPGNIHHLARS